MNLAGAISLFAGKTKTKNMVVVKSTPSSAKAKLHRDELTGVFEKAFAGKLSSKDALTQAQDVIEESYIRNGKQAWKQLGITPDEDMQAALEKAASAFGKERRGILKDILKDAAKAKKSGAQDDKTLWRFSKDRAAGIGEYEVGNSQGAGFGGGAKASGKKRVGKIWVTEDNPCDVCQENEGDEEIGLDEAFSSGDFAAPAHPNCVCHTAYVWE